MRQNSRIILVNEEQPAPAGDEPWFGKTLYPLTKDAAAKFGTTYVGDLTKKFNNKTIRSRGHIWSAQASPKKKNVKDSADLKDSRMSLEDRLALSRARKQNWPQFLKIRCGRLSFTLRRSTGTE